MNIAAVKFKEAKRIVIKIGASQLIDIKTGNVNTSWLNNLTSLCADLIKEKKEIVIVSSGAVILGCNILNIPHIKSSLGDKQIASSVGQIELMDRYKTSFALQSLNVAQVVLTIEDIENRKRFTSARNVIEGLIGRKVIPIINQNDVIATAEIRFGDNDRLSARAAQIANADLLILFANLDGLYTQDPTIDKNASFIKEVYEVNSDVEKMATDSMMNTGGMSAKVAAAKIAMNYNCKVVIANGKNPNALKNIIDNGRATCFIPGNSSNTKYLKE
jgi:glutamate 5-kinase